LLQMPPALQPQGLVILLRRSHNHWPPHYNLHTAI
jgi:hypothetical protein